MTSDYYNKIFLFYFGAIWGSFFYTLALRYINNSIGENSLNALFSRSKCPVCNTKIKIPYLIPIFGYLFTKGKCDNCKYRLSILYPISEILWGLLLLYTLSVYGINPYSVSLFIIISIAIVISIVDIKTYTIPDSLIITTLIFAIYPVINQNSYLDSLYGLLLMAIFFIIIMLIFPGSFGGGDLKYSVAIGFFSGLELSIVVLEIALITGAISGIIYAIYTKKGLKSKIAFGPFLAAGLILSIFHGRLIVLSYYNFIN